MLTFSVEQAILTSHIVPSERMANVIRLQKNLQNTEIPRKRRSGVDTTHGCVNTPELSSFLLRQASEKSAAQDAKKQRVVKKKQEAEQKVLKNAEDLKTVETTFRGGNTDLKGINKSVMLLLSPCFQTNS